MFPWLLLFLTFAFAYLAYDTSLLVSTHNSLPYSVIAKVWGQELSYLPLSEQEKFKHYPIPEVLSMSTSENPDEILRAKLNLETSRIA